MALRPCRLPVWTWQLLLMALLGSSSLLVVPVLLRWVDTGLMARLMLAQVAVFNLVMLVQFGFAWSGPSALAQDPASAAQLFAQAWRTRLWLLAGPGAVLAGLGYWLLAADEAFLAVFVLLLLASALNSNWFLQAQGDFASGVWFCLAGVLFSLGLLGAAVLQVWPLQPSLVVLILILPQTVLGLGSFVQGRLRAGAAAPLTYSALWAGVVTDAPLVLGQFLLLASTTVGSLVVGSLAAAELTAAYAATERLFNLLATVLVGLYSAYYPALARRYHTRLADYWRAVASAALGLLAAGLPGLLILAVWGPDLLAWYLGAPLAASVAGALLPLGGWLLLCLSQHILTGYLVFAGQQRRVLLLNSLVLLLTLLCGYSLARINPVYWPYGMLAGQCLPVAGLLYYAWQARRNS